MRIALATSAALLLAGAAFLPAANAQTSPQTQWGTSQTQSQSYGSGAHSTQPYGAGQTQHWTTGQTQSGTMAPSQTQTYGTANNQLGLQGQLPEGSYRSNCNDVRMQNDTLIAFCQKPDGTWQTSAIGPVNQCVGDIQNMNGQLICNESGVGSSTAPAYHQKSPAWR